MTRESTVARVLLALACAPAVVGLAGPAYGDPVGTGDSVNTDFLNSLVSEGITYNDAGQVIAIAKTVCRLVDTGEPSPQIASQLAAHFPVLTTERAAQFTATAQRSYCPGQPVPSGGDAE